MVQLPELTRDALASTALPSNERALHELFFHHPAEFARVVPQEDNGLTVLKLYLHWLTEMQARYDELGIPAHIYADNLTDIRLWCEDFIAKTGLPGIREWRWVGKSLRLELFRLGRLQFDPKPLENDMPIGGTLHPAGTPVLSVHIPAGEPLDPEAVLASFRQAEDFFPRYFDQHYPLFYCHSWLLEPSLAEILPDNSRILQFQRMFSILESGEDRQAEERVFGCLEDDPAAYPENTSLQRALKAHLCAGNKARAASGVRLCGC